MTRNETKPEPKFRKWKSTEVPVGAKLRWLSSDNKFGKFCYSVITSCTDQWINYPRLIYCSNEIIMDYMHFGDLVTCIYEYEYSVNNGITWQRCGVWE